MCKLCTFNEYWATVSNFYVLFQLQDFRMKAGSILPRIPKNDPPQSRTEFEGLTDLLQYLITEDERKKQGMKEGSEIAGKQE